jgi:hypothetical protein
MRNSRPLFKFFTHPSSHLSETSALSVVRLRDTRNKNGAQLPFARPPHALVVLKDGAHAAAAPSHLFRLRGGPRESLEPGHEFGLVRGAVRGRRTMFSNFGVRLRGTGGCSATRARRRRRRARSDALHGPGGSKLSCHTAMRPLLSSEPPVWSRSRAISHTVVRPPLFRKTTDGPETRPDRWFRRTKGGGRPSQVVCGPAGPNLAVIHQPTEAPHATPELSRRCRARRPAQHFEQTPSKTIPAHRMFRGVGNSFETRIIKS